MNVPKIGIIEYSEAIPEKSFQSIRPDVTAKYKGQVLFFEVAVTHFVELSKEQYLATEKHKCIEINLSQISLELMPKEIESEILNELRNKKMLYWESESDIQETNKKFRVHPLLGVILTFIGGYLIYKGLTRRKYNK